MLSTAIPPLIHNLFTLLSLLFSTAALAAVFIIKNKNLPTKTSQNKLRREVSELSGDLADLGDRFTRFQKREGMRDARESKQSAAALQAEAERIVAQGASGGVAPPVSGARHPKADLYKRRGH